MLHADLPIQKNKLKSWGALGGAPAPKLLGQNTMKRSNFRMENALVKNEKNRFLSAFVASSDCGRPNHTLCYAHCVFRPCHEKKMKKNHQVT